ncbi:EGF-like domain family protein [Acanthocheilonema viteae]
MGDRCEEHCDCLNGGECLRKGSLSICVCPIGFNGTLCEHRQPSKCDEMPCVHGRCILIKSLDTFRCECQIGFTGERCDERNYCESNPCKNNGVCISTTGGYRCECPEGFHGNKCELDVNECHSNPCLRGKCINEFGSYRCECPNDFTGRNCEIFSFNVDPCSTSPCHNNAKCYTYRDKYYSCECRPGFTGRHCEVNIDDCSGSACMNGGSCIDREEGYECKCPPFYTGRFCEEDIDECELGLHECKNGATCFNKKEGYHCVCVNGWEGVHCEINKDDCVDALCEAGSTCVDHLAKYTCECPAGRIGLFCHMEDPCLSNPCRVGSVCEPDTSSGKYTCECPKGYTGDDCSDDINECNQGHAVCYNGGTCVNTPGSFHCECPPGYTDWHCQTHVNQCSTNPCLNSGTCLDYGTRFKCVCMSGFHGERCELHCPPGYEGENCERRQFVECSMNDCLNGGVCSKGSCRCPPGFTGDRCEKKSDPCKYHNCPQNAICIPTNNGATYKCECKLGFYGHDCKLEMNECASNPCQHGGVCTDHLNGYVCSCSTGYTGEQCQTNIDDCIHNPCLHGGTCIDGINSYSCHCALPYDGDRCQYELDPCRTNRCENGAICKPTPTYRNYTCSCSTGFYGYYCDIDINDCAVNNPCHNGGTCINTFGSYQCRCLDGYTGRNCENDRDDCLPSPCLNGGHCVDELNGYHCECLVGFTGRQCATNIDECESSPCENGASCIDHVNGFECVCRRGFSGTFCQTNDNDCQSGLCLNGGTCVDGVNSYRCRCQRGFTGKNCQHQIDLEQFNITDLLEHELCAKHDCAAKANNKVCDQVCNYYACHYDDGDCSAGTKPFEKCEPSSYCAHVFRDGKCDPVCNNQECLFDGFDCDSIPEQCPKNDYCTAHYADGQCDQECNVIGCGWDGGDCDSFDVETSLAGNIIVVLLISPDEFLRNAQTFLFTLSQKLRGAVHIRMMNGKPMIYSWSSEGGIGPLYDIPQEKRHLLISNIQRNKRQTGHLRGTMVMLTVDVSYCQKIDREECFSDLFSVVDYLGAANAKQELQELGMPMHSARVELANAKQSKGISWQTLIICLLVFVTTILIAYSMVQQGRKRKTLRARIWHPPPSESCKSSTGNLDTYSIHSGYLFSNYGSAKRSRSDNVPVGIAHPNLYIGEDTQLFLKPKTAGTDERQWTHLHEAADSTLPISLPIEPLLVNVRGKHGRTAMMQTASNQAKNEEASCEDIRNLLEAGAEIDAQDDSEDTALMLAVKSGRTTVVDCLLKNGADPTLVDEKDRTPLHHAVAVNIPNIVQLLLDTRQVNVDALDEDNRTPLIICSKFDIRMGTEIAEMLLKAKADVACAGDKSLTKYDGRTALHFASQHANLDIIRLLIHNGANKDAQDSLDQTPLFLAASEGHLDAVECLISLGASKEITDQKERSPRDVAAEKEFRDIVHYLDTVPTPRILPSNMAANLALSAHQRFKKSFKKTTRPVIKKNPSPAYPSTLATVTTQSATAANPLTPPNSDGSNYSTTPSPHDTTAAVHGGTTAAIRGTAVTQATTGHPENIVLQSSSVMLSPYSDHHNGIGCSPPQMVTAMQAGWLPSKFSANQSSYQQYEEGLFYGTGMLPFPYDQRTLRPSYSQSHMPHVQQPPTAYYNV